MNHWMSFTSATPVSTAWTIRLSAVPAPVDNPSFVIKSTKASEVLVIAMSGQEPGYTNHTRRGGGGGSSVDWSTRSTPYERGIGIKLVPQLEKPC